MIQMKFSRRSFLAGSSFLALGLLSREIGAWPFSGHGGAAPPSDFWLAAPDIVAFAVDDPPIVVGNIVSGSFNSRAYDSWFRMINPRTGNNEWCCPFGLNRDQVRFSDLPNPAGYLDKIALRSLANYTVGGATVVAIYYRDEAIGQGQVHSGSRYPSSSLITQRHTIFLQLTGPLRPGTKITISNSAPGTFATFNFTFDDKNVRAGGLQVNQIGQRPDDALKYAYLAVRIPGGPNHGVVDFVGKYGFSTFQILDSAKNSVFTGNIVQRVSAAATTGEGYDAGIDVADLSEGYSVTAISRSNPAVVTCPDHPFQTGDKCRFMGINGMYQIDAASLIPTGGAGHWVAPTVTVLDTNTFSVNVNSTAFSAFVNSKLFSEALGGVNNKVFRCFNTNRSGTYVFGLDFSRWIPEASGTYYLYIPGYGISDPFRIVSEAWAIACAKTHEGIFNQRLGIAVSSESGYARGPAIVDGVNGCTNYQSTLPAMFSTEGGEAIAPPGAPIGANGQPVALQAGLGAYVDIGTLQIASAEASGGLGVITTAVPHGVAKGASFAVQVVGCMPAIYNLPSLATSTGRNTFTYSLQGNNPPPATALGMVRTGFVTRTRTGGRPGHQDAGDNDDLAVDHMPGWKLLAFVFRNIPKASRFTPYRVPLSSEVLDPILFAGTDSLPPLFHELFWYSEAYRTTQMPDGSIWGGYGYGKFASQIADYPETIDKYRGTDAGGPLTGQIVMGFSYARDHYTTFLYAGLAAILAQIAYDYNLTALGDAYKESSIVAYAWADNLATNISNCENYYNGTLNLRSKAGWSNLSYQHAMQTLNGCAGVPGRAIRAKYDAAGSLFRLLGATAGRTPYGDFFEQRSCYLSAIVTRGSGYAAGDIIMMAGGSGIIPTKILVTSVDDRGSITGHLIAHQGQYTIVPKNPVLQDSTTGTGTGASFNFSSGQAFAGADGSIGAYDYCVTPGASVAAKSYLQNRGPKTPDVGLNPSIGYQGMMFGTGPNTSGGTKLGSPLAAIVAHANYVQVHGVRASRRSPYLSLMQAGCSFIQGANLPNKAFQTGTGPRPYSCVLHEDSYKYGSAAPHGIIPYGYFAWAGSFMFFNFAGSISTADGPLIFNADNVTGSYESQPTPGSAKMWNPWRFGSSYWEWAPENRNIIFNSEFDLAGSLLATTAVQLYLHGWDGNV